MLQLAGRRPVLAAIVAGLLTAVVTLLLPNYYSSEARLLPVDSKGLSGSLGGMATAAAAFGISIPTADNSETNFVEILNSRWMREQLLRSEFVYHRRSWRFGQERLTKGTLQEYLGQKNMDRAVRRMGTCFFVTKEIKSKIVTISADTKYPELSQQMVEKACKLLEGFLQRKGRTRGGAKALFAEARLLEARQELDEAEGALRRFLEGNRNSNVSPDPAIRLKGLRLENELKLRQQLIMTLAMNREEALLEEKNDIPILNVLDAANLPLEKSRPARSVYVLLAAFLAALGCLAWDGRSWIQGILFDLRPSDRTPNEES